MALKVDIDISRKFTLASDIDSVFDFLSNVPESASHFPKVAALTEIATDTYKWEMEKVNLGTHSAQTAYACLYTSNKAEGTVAWTPIKGEGNAIVSGSWTLTQGLDDGHTDVAFSTKAQLTLPLPGLLKLAIGPVVKIEFSGMIDTYIKNIEGHFAAP